MIKVFLSTLSFQSGFIQYRLKLQKSPSIRYPLLSFQHYVISSLYYVSTLRNIIQIPGPQEVLYLRYV